MLVGTSFSASKMYGFATSASAASKVDVKNSEQSQSFYSNLADYDSTDNAIFQNLLEDESVQDNVTLNEDGTYTFHREEGATLSWKEGLVQQLISEQNDTTNQLSSEFDFSDGELATFRQMTGYNLFQAGGAYTVCDDHGNPVAESDAVWVQQAWDMFGSAKIGADGDITADKLRDYAGTLKGFSSNDEELDMINFLLDIVDKNLSNHAEQASDQGNLQVAAVNEATSLLTT